MNAFLADYLPIALFFVVAGAIGGAMAVAAWLIAPQRPDPEKLSSYECGFGRFDVRFYLVAILFIIFDLEIAFLFPWALALGDIGLYGFGSMMVFLALLTAGFVYEWRKGALEWE